MDVTELFALLESKESNIVDDVKTLIHENLKSCKFFRKNDRFDSVFINFNVLFHGLDN